MVLLSLKLLKLMIHICISIHMISPNNGIQPIKQHKLSNLSQTMILHSQYKAVHGCTLEVFQQWNSDKIHSICEDFPLSYKQHLIPLIITSNSIVRSFSERKFEEKFICGVENIIFTCVVHGNTHRAMCTLWGHLSSELIWKVYRRGATNSRTWIWHFGDWFNIYNLFTYIDILHSIVNIFYVCWLVRAVLLILSIQNGCCQQPGSWQGRFRANLLK